MATVKPLTEEEKQDIRQCLEFVKRTGNLKPTWKNSDYWVQTTERLLTVIEDRERNPRLF